MTAGQNAALARPFPLRCVGLLLAAVIACLLSACDGPPAQPLRVGLNPWIGYDPLVLARERHLFAPAELGVVELETSGESVRQLRNGLIDAAGLTLPEAMELAAAGADIRVVAILSQSRGADAVLARAGLSMPGQLRGARIGMEDSALAAIMLQRLLEAGELRRDDIRIVVMPATEHEVALTHGSVDAVITFEPVISRLASAGFNIVLDSADMPGEVIDVLVVRADVLAARPPQVIALLQAFEQGRRALLADPPAAARELAPGADLTADEYVRALSRIRLFSRDQSDRMLQALPDSPALALSRISSDLRSGGRIMAEPDWRRLFAVPAAGAQP